MKSRRVTTIVGLAAVCLLAACGSDDKKADTGSTTAGSTAGSTATTAGAEGSTAAPTGESITVMIGSSGPAEAAAVQAAVAAWEAESGNKVELIAADDLNLQLGQALAGGEPPDAFYVGADKFQEFAAGGSLAPVGSKLDDPDDFYEPLRKVFTYEDELYCAPKDFSTLALIINNKSWEAAGLTDADIPKSWDELSAVAEKLTTGSQVGLATGAEGNRVGAFMAGAGGFFVNEDQSEVTGDTPENAEALEFIKGMLDAGTYKFTPNLSVGWGGEAFGKELAAMTIEGNWIRGAMTADYPTIDYTVAEIPAGPKGPATMAFTVCWGVAEASDKQDVAVSFVNFMTKAETQLGFAEAFGVMPSRASVRDDYLAAFPDDAPFLAGGEYARGQVTIAGFGAVLTEFDKGLLGLADGSTDVATVLGDLQTNGDDALEG